MIQDSVKLTVKINHHSVEDVLNIWEPSGVACQPASVWLTVGWVDESLRDLLESYGQMDGLQLSISLTSCELCMSTGKTEGQTET